MSGSPLGWSVAAILICMLLGLAGNARQLWRAFVRRRLVARPERSPRQAATIWYERMTEKVARRGWRKLPTQTPAEFVRGIDDAVVRARVARFTRHYESARFDDSIDDVRRLPELYEEISIAQRR